MSLRMPAEHGAWGLLAVPFFSAAAVAGIPAPGARVPLFLVAAAILSLFLLRASLEAAMAWRELLAPPPLILAAVALAAGAPLLFYYRYNELLAPAAAGLVLYLAQRRLVDKYEGARLADAENGPSRSEKRSLAAELAGVATLSLTAPAAWIALRGRLDARGLEVWAMNLLFFLGGVLYVKYRVRALQAHRPFRSVAERLSFAWPVFLYHLALAAFLLFWFLGDGRAAAILLAFTPGILRAFQLAYQLGRRFPIRRLGWSEVAHSVVFAALLVLAFRLAAS